MDNTAAPKPPPPAFPGASYLQNQIGISISSGNYINTSQNESELPTWKKMQQAQQQDPAQAAFYQNAFGIQAPKRDNQFKGDSNVPEYLQKAAGMNMNGTNPKKRTYSDM